MNLDVLYKLFVDEKNEAETRSEKVDPCTGPTASSPAAFFNIIDTNHHLSSPPTAGRTK